MRTILTTVCVLRLAKIRGELWSVEEGYGQWRRVMVSGGGLVWEGWPSAEETYKEIQQQFAKQFSKAAHN